MSEEDQSERRKSDAWSKWGNIATIVAMIIGFGTMSATYLDKEKKRSSDEGKREQKLDFLVNQVADFAASRYTKEDAVKDKELETSHYSDLSERLKQLEFRANRSEDRNSRIESYGRGDPATAESIESKRRTR